MGRGKKQRLAMRKLYREAFTLHRGQYLKDPKKPCDTCAFRDPEAWVADEAMYKKVMACLEPFGPSFFCHEGLPVGEEDYEPHRLPDGEIDTGRMTPCGGFVRFAKDWWEKSPAEREEEVLRMQRHMIRRWAEDHPEIFEGHPYLQQLGSSRQLDVLQQVIQTMAEKG